MSSNEEWTPDRIIEVLDEHDGNPTSLADHNEIKYVLAEWRHDGGSMGKVKYQKVDDEINWRSVNMKSSLWDEVLEDAHEERQDDGGDEGDDDKDIPEMTAAEFQDSFDFKPLQDRQMAAKASEWCKANANIIFSNDQVWVLDESEGVWENEPRAVAVILQKLMGEFYGDNVKREFIEGYVATDPAYRVDWDEVGLRGPRCAVENGVLDLEKGEIVRDVKPEDYAIMRFPVKWEGEDAGRERFINDFLMKSVEKEDRKKLQEFAGLCLHTNEYNEKKALMMVGGGNNGKGVFEQILVSLLHHENTMHDDLKDLSDNQFGAHRLRESAANINSDISGNKIKETSMFKKLTGGDRIRVEAKFEQPFEIKNPAKMIFAANEIPKIGDPDLAFYSRWMFVHFPNRFTRLDDEYHDADPDLADDIIENELPGVLAWAVEGYQRLQEQDHFTARKTAEEVRRTWYDYADTTQTFVQNYVTPDPQDSADPAPYPTTVAEMYKYYERYVASTPTATRTKKSLATYIGNRFEEAETSVSRGAADARDRDVDTVRVWDGVHLTHESIQEINGSE